MFANKRREEKVQNCFADAQTYCYQLEEKIGEDLLQKLGGEGTLLIKRNLRRPFFRLDLDNGIRMKGILGDDCIRVSFPTETAAEQKRHFEDWFFRK